MDYGLRPQQAALKQRLHIPAPVGDHENVDVLGHDPVNDAIRFEKGKRWKNRTL